MTLVGVSGAATSIHARALIGIGRQLPLPSSTPRLEVLPAPAPGKRPYRVIRRVSARDRVEPLALLDLLAGELEALRTSMTARQVATERGLERSVACCDTLASAVGDFEGDARSFERRLIMTEAALERLHNAVEIIAKTLGIGDLSCIA